MFSSSKECGVNERKEVLKVCKKRKHKATVGRTFNVDICKQKQKNERKTEKKDFLKIIFGQRIKILF